MDAKAMLAAVAGTYANLKTLSVDLSISNESENDGGLSRNQQRARAMYADPDRVRLEVGGRRGTVSVASDGDLHHYFGGLKRYSKTVLSGRDSLPGWFRPEFPVGGGAVFLFNRIVERVVAAEILREEPAAAGNAETLCHVLSVSYEPPQHPGLTDASAPVLFWVDSVTNLVMRLEGTISHRLPGHDEIDTNHLTLLVTRADVNEPITPETFEFTIPPGAIDASDPYGRGGGIVSGGGGGIAGRGSKEGNWFESWGSHDWAGDTLIQRSKLKLHGLDLAFERRLTISDDRRELRLVERITTPAGTTERETTIPLA